ncbi:HPP family protein [Belnapia rosea]|uniref:CBS domain-containing membrane protein n=2 Tax=Belnapia rosea TaxID=938405 RepID=A0A1G6ZSQ1_9PROT|nr:HPP family protein [Belnapia rosea]SDB73708.1 CBS domain-containing membrane protein [Belnapia rosea]SDE04845.1 CBS domain-containing membrane protein [Belnapia rosea]
MRQTWLRAFLPAAMSASRTERLLGCCGALVGVLVTGFLCTWLAGPAASTPMLIAPLGASAVLLFAVPGSPLAQPWSIIGGNTVSALVGVTCAQWIGDPLLAAPLAAALAIGAMFALRCLHPPGGAIALTAVLGGPAVTAAKYGFVLSPVALNSAVLMLAAIAFNNATRRPYPHAQQVSRSNPHETADRNPTERLGIRTEDLDAVMRDYHAVLDVSRDDLDELVQKAEMHAYRRRFGEITCADVMSRDVVAVQFGTPLAEAWRLLRRHDIRALPVLDPARRVIGMVSDVDFMRNAELDHFEGLGARFRQSIRRLTTVHAERPEVVGQIMPRTIRTVAETTHVAELVPLMADAGFRHVPVVDGHRRLSGIISQSDLIAALYRGGLNSEEAGEQRKAA